MADKMFGKVIIAALALVLSLLATGIVLFAVNTAPEVAPVPAGEAAYPTRPYLAKLHAQWCPVCMLTKGAWAEIEREYAGRVNFVVFDSTTEADRERSRTEADRLGLRRILDDYYGATGMVLVIDPGTERVIAQLGGLYTFDEYREAIDAALSSVPGQG